MKTKTLMDAVQLAHKTGIVFIATSDTDGKPHIASAGKINSDDYNRLKVTEWFCPKSLANLQSNENISIVIWDKISNSGYQIIGQVEKTRVSGVLNGHAPVLEEIPPLPQIKNELTIHVDKIMDFTQGPHSDMEKCLTLL